METRKRETFVNVLAQPSLPLFNLGLNPGAEGGQREQLDRIIKEIPIKPNQKKCFLNWNSQFIMAWQARDYYLFHWN